MYVVNRALDLNASAPSSTKEARTAPILPISPAPWNVRTGQEIDRAKSRHPSNYRQVATSTTIGLDVPVVQDANSVAVLALHGELDIATGDELLMAVRRNLIEISEAKVLA